MDIRGREYKGWNLIELEGSLDLHSIQDFKTLFNHLANQDKNILFDLKHVKNVDSSGIACLMYGQKVLSRKNINLRFSNLNPAVKIVFQITRGYEIFEIFDDIDFAVLDFRDDQKEQEVA